MSRQVTWCLCPAGVAHVGRDTEPGSAWPAVHSAPAPSAVAAGWPVGGDSGQDVLSRCIMLELSTARGSKHRFFVYSLLSLQVHSSKIKTLSHRFEQHSIVT